VTAAHEQDDDGSLFKYRKELKVLEKILIEDLQPFGARGYNAKKK